MTALFCFACNDSKTVTVTVTNPLAMERSNEMVEVSMETITNRLGLADTAQIVVLDADGQQVPYQITYDGKVIFPATIAANGAATYTIQTGIPEAFDVKACGKCYPERMDDMAWENDLVAFRAYGPALQAKGERGFAALTVPLCRPKESVASVMTCLRSIILPNRYWKLCTPKN